ncbi:MAG: ComF family protein [Propioniciclava sp.]|uniref:ComF family protein n=1 Tax=Propioniciclava sp. TaxID=2038686 RepID=UPI0039E533F1
MDQDSWLPGRLADAAASLLLGAVCPGCERPSARLCLACRAELDALVAETVDVRGSTVPVAAAGRHEGLLRALVIAYKERQAWWLRDVLGALLAEAVARALLDTGGGREVVLVPVPSLPASVRARGLDVTRALAVTAARRLSASGLPARVESGLRHARTVDDQAELGESARWRNLSGALVAKPGRPGLRVVVDDLTTTGASLAEACRALAAASLSASACAVIAATPRRDGRRAG